jgi:hypothetical protein
MEATMTTRALATKLKRLENMTLPWLADILTGLVYYFAGMLAAQREARWYGSRCLGLAAGLFCSVLVWTLPQFWQALLAILLVGGLVATAAWGSFLTGGAYAPQPRRAKFALALTLLMGMSFDRGQRWLQGEPMTSSAMFVIDGPTRNRTYPAIPSPRKLRPDTGSGQSLSPSSLR